MHITPSDLDWGVVPVLTSIPKVITLSNESLIPARFTANMVGTTSKTNDHLYKKCFTCGLSFMCACL